MCYVYNWSVKEIEDKKFKTPNKNEYYEDLVQITLRNEIFVFDLDVKKDENPQCSG